LTGTGLIPYLTNYYCPTWYECPTLQPASKTTTSASTLNTSSVNTSSVVVYSQYAYIPVQSSNILGIGNTTPSSTELIFSSQQGIGSGVGLLPGQGTYVSVGLKPEALDPSIKDLPIYTVHLTPQQKNAYNESATNYAYAAGAMGGLGTIIGIVPTPQTITAGKATQVVAAFLATSAGELRLIALDPADNNFTSIQSPVVPSLSNLLISSNNGLSQNTVDATNSLINNYSQVVGVSNALLTSLNRADGATTANNEYWRIQQIQAAETDSQLLSQLLSIQPDLLQNYVNAIKSDPSLANLTITKNQVDDFQLSLRVNGFSAQELQIFADLGIDSDSQSIIMKQLLSLDSNSLTGSFGDLLSSSLLDPVFNSSIVQASNAAARGVIDPLATSVPEPSEIPGFIILLGSIFYLRARVIDHSKKA
jgi:hypothetical protein